METFPEEKPLKDHEKLFIDVIRRFFRRVDAECKGAAETRSSHLRVGRRDRLTLRELCALRLLLFDHK